MIQVIYDPSTGEILRVVKSNTPQARDGEAMLEAERGTIFNDVTHFVDISGPAPALTRKPE